MKNRFLFIFLFFIPFWNLLFAQPTVFELDVKKGLTQMEEELIVKVKPWVVPNRIFDVREYGAKGDTCTINTIAIQQAIDVCSKVGGGVVLIENGHFVTGTIELKSGVMLEVRENAKLLGSTSLQDYPDKVENARSVMRDILRYRISLIYAENQRNIGIRGKGEIYFRGEKINFPGPETVVELEGRPFGIRMIGCKEVAIQDIFLHNSAAWMQSYMACDNLLIEGIRVNNHANYNNDGLDIDGCHNVIVRNCVINAEDDAMCLKGGSGRSSENILIENSTFYSTCNALKIGTDTQDNFKNIVARNLVVSGVPYNLHSFAGHQASTGITITTVDGADISDVWISNIVINQSRCPIFIKTGSRGRVLPEKQTNVSPGKISRILIENVSGENNLRQGSFISGLKNHWVEDITIRNVDLKMDGGGTAELISSDVNSNEKVYSDAKKFSKDGLPAYGFYIRFAQNIQLDNVVVKPQNHDMRPFVKVGEGAKNIIVNGSPLVAN